jgi:regulator of sigma E protease
VEFQNSFDQKEWMVPFLVHFMSVPKEYPKKTLYPETFFDHISLSFSYLQEQFLLLYKAIKNMISGQLPLSNIGGPVSMVEVAGHAAKDGVRTFLLVMSFMSVNVGIVNLLPFPALDGGHLLLQFLEALYGKPLSQNLQIKIQKMGIIFLFILFILVFCNDIMRLFKS